VGKNFLDSLFGIGFLAPGIVPAAAQSAQPPVRLTVDLTDAARSIYHVEMQMPVAPGPLTLVYPKWVQGHHAPTGPLPHMTGLKFIANSEQLPWRRDLAHMYTFHLTVPDGVHNLTITMDMLNIPNMTPYLVDMVWNSVLLYRAGRPVHDLIYQANVTLPENWNYASSLDETGHDGNLVHFAPLPLDRLIESPVMAGAYYRKVALADSPRVTFNLFADSEPLLSTLTDEQIDAYRKLVSQAYALFGSHHYDHYDFLVALSDHISVGLEHHQSSENGAGAEYYADPKRLLADADLLSHEFTHSWNGKFRRPSGLATPDYQQPMHDELLWVYEGLTQYLGEVLAARDGLWRKQDFREQLAHWAAIMDHRTGRAWRSLQDTADAGPLRDVTPRDWANCKRLSGLDLYIEGVLLWLDVDTKIRALSHGKHSLNDFCQLFYGMDNGSDAIKTYTFDDLVAALNQVQPHNWALFLRHLLDRTGQGAPLDGIERGGWRLVYTDTPSDYAKAANQRGKHKTINLMFSIGLKMNDEGKVHDVLWNGPAFKAGLGAGMTVTSVNDMQFTPDGLSRAITFAKNNTQPIRLLVKNQDWYVTYDVDYHDGLRYPHLERRKETKNYLDDILSPLPG
jgi:predicted metalloprotease with PDZ domain